MRSPRSPLSPDSSARDWTSKEARAAYAAVLTDSRASSFLQAFVLGLGLARHCAKERVLIHSPAVPAAYLEVLQSVWHLETTGTWPELAQPGRPKELLTRLRVLGLKYDKVLALELGLVVTSSLDDVFEARCPAFAGDNWPLLLLQPSKDLLRRISSETAHRSQYPSFPPRGLKEEDEIQVYLRRFFHTCTGLFPLPEELRPDDVSGRLRDCKARSFWQAPASALASVLYSSDLEQVGQLTEMLGKVDGQRCVDCGVPDASGREDPLDRRWRCRLCNEQLLLESMSPQEIQHMPLLAPEEEELRKELGECFTGGRQKYHWTCGNQQTFLELRPGHLLWHGYSGVGVWRKWTQKGEVRLAIHLQQQKWEGQTKVQEEVRHTLDLKRDSNPPVFQESQRDVFRPLGFAWEGRRSSERPRVTLEAFAARSADTARGPRPQQAQQAEEPAGAQPSARSKLSYLLSAGGTSEAPVLMQDLPEPPAQADGAAAADESLPDASPDADPDASASGEREGVAQVDAPKVDTAEASDDSQKQKDTAEVRESEASSSQSTTGEAKDAEAMKEADDPRSTCSTSKPEPVTGDTRSSDERAAARHKLAYLLK
ncbi:unnamed protein product [Effrenium voratum]|uniref:Uncharacterized protein n=1 Tax=Effrenium voratum TaxID=2562239 RepID=A0AA36JNT1_9DINO|nr:unnamed protein product [Effrenium voratum]